MNKLILFFVLCFLFVGCYQDAILYDYGPSYQKTHVEGIKPSILFLGDSRIDLLNFSDFIDNEYWNYGHGGYTSARLLNEIMPLTTEIYPDKIVIGIGVNDVFAYVSFYDIYNNIEKIIDICKGKVDSRNIYLVNIVPTITMDTIFVNKILSDLAKNTGVNFIYLRAMEYNNLLIPSYSNDGIHFTAKGKEVFVNGIVGEIYE